MPPKKAQEQLNGNELEITDEERQPIAEHLGDEPDSDERDEAALTAEERQAEQDFEAAFNSARADAPVRGTSPEGKADTPAADAVAQPAAEQPKKEAQPGAQTPAADPWADVNPIVRDTIQQLTQGMTALPKLEHSLRSAVGRMNAMQTGKAAAQAAAAAGGDAPNARQIEAAAKAGDKEWEELKEDWPQWAAAIERREVALLEKLQPQTVDTDALVQQVSQRVALDPEAIVQHVATEIKHPGWKRTINKPEFRQWYDAQPEDVRALGASDAAADAIALLDQYAGHRDEQTRQQRNQSRLDNAVAPRGTGGGRVPDQSAEAAFDAGFKSVRGG